MTLRCGVCGSSTNVARSRALGIICGGCILWTIMEFKRHGRSIE